MRESRRDSLDREFDLARGTKIEDWDVVAGQARSAALSWAVVSPGGARHLVRQGRLRVVDDVAEVSWDKEVKALFPPTIWARVRSPASRGPWPAFAGGPKNEFSS